MKIEVKVVGTVIDETSRLVTGIEDENEANRYRSPSPQPPTPRSPSPRSPSNADAPATQQEADT